MTMQKKKAVFLLIIFVTLAGILYWIVWADKALMITEIHIADSGLPKEFSGFRIAQISDLHNAEFGEGNEKLLRMLEECSPDIIAVTGDLIDSQETAAAISFLKSAVKLAPVYFVTGNHEARVYDTYMELETEMERLGIHVLHNEAVYIEQGDAAIQLIGMDDPSFARSNAPGLSNEEFICKNLGRLKDEDVFSVLLAHRPELIDSYSGAELVFSGHAHGGQFRLPFLGGLAAPGQGFFPEYDSGLYEKGDTHMVVSRGLGNSVIPFRLNNRPEIVLAILSSGE